MRRDVDNDFLGRLKTGKIVPVAELENALIIDSRSNTSREEP